MTEFEMLLACYRSGQMSERQWQEHLRDREFRRWVEEEAAVPEKLIVVRESEWRQMRKALAKCAEGWGNAVEFDLLPRRHHAAAIRLRDEARAALSHPALDGCGREGEQIEAAARAIANAWGETWECCCTEQRGLDCDCGDAMPDGRDGYHERLTRDDCRRAARAALSALAKAEAVP